MWGFEGLEMHRFGIRPGRASELDTTYLAAIVVEFLEFMRLQSFLDVSFLPLEVFFHFDQPKTPDKKPGPPNVPPVVVNCVQAIVPIAGIWRMGRAEPCPTDNADRQAVQSVLSQRQIATKENLMAYLPTGLRVTPAVAGIKNGMLVILSIFIAARQNHRIGTRPSTTGDTGNAGSVDSSPGERLARDEVGADRMAWNMAKSALGHRLAGYESRGNEPAVWRTGTERPPACASGWRLSS